MYYKKIYKKSYEFNNVALQHYTEMEQNKDAVKSFDERGEFLLVPTELVGEFVVTTLSREDLEVIGADGEQISDNDMASIASEVEDGILEGAGFWDALREAVTQ